MRPPNRSRAAVACSSWSRRTCPGVHASAGFRTPTAIAGPSPGPPLPDRAIPKHVFLLTRDLLFRGKLCAVCAAAGAEAVKDEAACDLSVLALDAPGAADRLPHLVRRAVPLLPLRPPP